MNGDLLNQPLRGVAIYNPARLLSKQELIDQFVVRTSLLYSLLDDLHRVGPDEPAQHYLLVGQRGMGKTTLLRRLRYAIEDDAQLAAVWLPLDFPEEQYNVARLSDLYVNWLDALGDTLQTQGKGEDADRLDAAVDALPDDEEERAAQALRMLIDEAERLERRFLLLIDNIDLVLDRLKDEHWEIRKVLAAETRLTVIGASSQAVEATYQYDQAFYDFFQIHDLRGLDAADMGRLLMRLAELHHVPQVVRQLDADPGRLPTLHVLTGGNPRTAVLLYEVLASGGGGNVRTDLDRLLDQHTPLYKSRFESLSAQAQQIVDALAIHWHPITAADLSAIVRLPVNAVSAQLDRLVKQGLVEKVAYYEPESRAGFQIAERLFNIWYLMRASRRVRRKLIWLVEFLRLYHGPAGLRHNAQRYLHDKPPDDSDLRLRHAEYGLALSESIAEAPLRSALVSSSIRALLSDSTLRSRIHELLDFDESDTPLRDRATAIQDWERCRERIFAAKVSWPDWAPERFWEELVGCTFMSVREKADLAEALDTLSQQEIASLHETFAEDRAWLAEGLGSTTATDQLVQAFREGYMMFWDDFGGATEAAERLGLNELPAIALAARLETEFDPELLDCLEAALSASQCPVPWYCWAEHAVRAGKPLDQIHAACERALQLGSRNAETCHAVGNLYAGKLARYADAEAAYRRAIELDPKYFPAWNSLAWFLYTQRRDLAEAEQAAWKAVELAPHNPFATCRLATILIRRERWEDAVVQIRRFLPGRSETYHTAISDDVVNLFREAVTAQRAGEALALLDELGLADRWLPIREALAAAHAGTPKYLRRVAPEVRRPAEEILAVLQSEALSGDTQATDNSTRTAKSGRSRAAQVKSKKPPGEGKSGSGRSRR